MGKHEKNLHKWTKNPPSDVPFRDFIAFAEHFGLHLEMPARGAHPSLIDTRLNDFKASKYSKGCGNFDINNDTLTIPVSGGKKVKKLYVKRVVSFIRYVQESEDND